MSHINLVNCLRDLATAGQVWRTDGRTDGRTEEQRQKKVSAHLKNMMLLDFFFVDMRRLAKFRWCAHSYVIQKVRHYISKLFCLLRLMNLLAKTFHLRDNFISNLLSHHQDINKFTRLMPCNKAVVEKTLSRYAHILCF